MYTPIKRVPNTSINEMASPRTPPVSSFSRELRQVLQERNLFTAKTRNKVCSMLNSSSNSNPASPNPESNKRRNFRVQAIEEIIVSEKAYLNQLELLMEYFVRPLKAQHIIDDTSHTALFGQIEMIHNLNAEFLRVLESNMENVAQAFLKMAPFFKLYSVYAFDYRSSLLTLQELTSKNANFRKFIEQAESRPEVQRKLNSLLIVPIQRVPRYKLLLEQVLLYTSPADMDFKLLKESVKQIESTVSHINSCVEDQEVTQYLINLQNSLVNRMPNIVKPSRKVIKEGFLQKVTRNGTEIRRYCVLMSDIFMYCKVHKERSANTVVENSLECCCIFPLKKTKVYELLPGNFKITCQGDGVIFATTDLQLCRTWVGFIRDAIDLHIQCRKTLRKESSKRKPMRKKDLKNFGSDYVLSPNKRKCEYESIFRNIIESEDERELDSSLTAKNCFGRSKVQLKAASAISATTTTTEPHKQQKDDCVLLRKRKAPPVPPTDEAGYYGQLPTANRISKLYKQTRGILKRGNIRATAPTPSNYASNIGSALVPATTNDVDNMYGFASRYSDTQSYFRAHNVDNTIPTAQAAINMQHMLREGLNAAEVSENFRDILYPLRLSGGKGNQAIASSNKENHAKHQNEQEHKTFDFTKSLYCTSDNTGNWIFPKHFNINSDPQPAIATPPHKKRVKFEDTVAYREKKRFEPYPLFSGSTSTALSTAQPEVTLRDRLSNFFAKLWFK